MAGHFDAPFSFDDPVLSHTSCKTWVRQRQIHRKPLTLLSKKHGFELLLSCSL